MVRLVQHYAPILNERIGRGIRHPNDPELGGLARARRLRVSSYFRQERLATFLKRKGYAVVYQEVGGTHEPVHWRGEFAEGLISLTK